MDAKRNNPVGPQLREREARQLEGLDLASVIERAQGHDAEALGEIHRHGQARPEVKQNLFGGSIGGPLGLEAKGGYLFANYQGTRQKSGLSSGAIISTVLPVLPSDRSAASLSMAGFGNAFTPIDPVVLALLNVKSNQFGGAGGGWRIPSLPPTFDRTNRLVLSYDYALPFLAHTHGWQSAVLGPRSVSGITVFQSGLPSG
jgi:hypothetical protein